MKKILIFGGTTEGRCIANVLSQSGIFCDVRVATEYGEQVMKENYSRKENKFLEVNAGRLSLDQMKALCSKGFDAVIDATHPFALCVSENIKQASEGLPLLRFERKTHGEYSDFARYFGSMEECAGALKNTSGKILLTTGSKDLHLFCKDPELKDRLIVRVLPGLESLKLCLDENLEGKQIVAMQGPFSLQMNKTLLSEYGIQVLVTKESGKTGGFDEKILAAKECSVKCFVIKNHSAEKQGMSVSSNYEVFTEYEKLYTRIQSLTGVEIQNKGSLKITLAGLGPGSRDFMTVNVQKALEEADYVFGAERMIEGLSIPAKKMPYYMAKDVIPVVERLREEKNEMIKIVVLFSGDTGFFSGQGKLFRELQKLENTEITVLPGISSIQILSSKTGIDWQDAEIISMHGKEEEEWLPPFKKGIDQGKKLFLLTSGAEDIQKIGKLLVNSSCRKDYKIYAGFNLSYHDEELLNLTPEECLYVTKPGLYSVFIF